MENLNKKPLLIVAFFSLVIAMFFTAEQLQPSNAPASVLKRTAKTAKHHACRCRHQLKRKIGCPARIAKKVVKRVVKGALHEVKDRLPH